MVTVLSKFCQGLAKPNNNARYKTDFSVRTRATLAFNGKLHDLTCKLFHNKHKNKTRILRIIKIKYLYFNKRSKIIYTYTFVHFEVTKKR